MILEIPLCSITKVELQPYVPGSGDTYTTSKIHFRAPAGAWPKSASDINLFGSKLRAKAISLAKPVDPVSIDLRGLKVVGADNGPGERLFKIDSGMLRDLKIARGKNDPQLTFAVFVKTRCKDIADFHAECPSWTGYAVLESVSKELFDGPPDEHTAAEDDGPAEAKTKRTRQRSLLTIKDGAPSEAAAASVQ